jgi:hypothetical protein
MKRATCVVVFAIAIAMVHTEAVQAQLLAAYDFDTNTGTAAGAAANDISGFGTPVDAVIQGNASIVTDATRPGAGPNNQVLFTGSLGLGAFSPYDPKLDTLGSFTLAAWVKTSNNSTWEAIVGRGPFAERIFNQQGANSSAMLAISNSNLGGFEAFDFGPGSPNNTSDGQWHHLAASLDASTGTVVGYIDGVPTTYLNTGINLLTAINNGMDIGGRQFDNGDRFPNSYIDDVAYWKGFANPGIIAQIASGAIDATSVANIVPEPSSLGLIGLASLIGLTVRRRKIAV